MFDRVDFVLEKDYSYNQRRFAALQERCLNYDDENEMLFFSLSPSESGLPHPDSSEACSFYRCVSNIKRFFSFVFSSLPRSLQAC